MILSEAGRLGGLAGKGKGKRRSSAKSNSKSWAKMTIAKENDRRKARDKNVASINKRLGL